MAEVTLKSVEEAVFQKLGATSALFMSNPEAGTRQVMPTAALEVLGQEIMEVVRQYGVAQRRDEVLQADQRLKNQFGEDWLEFRDVRIKELDNAA